ncbi:hypothetical protein G7Y79_00012g032540 [Physcia stellaris]|nr:hypothetical protein G7Y79_00012g032540 [Physcia stellaris]
MRALTLGHLPVYQVDEDDWKRRRRYWNMQRREAFRTNPEELADMELWLRKDGQGRLEIVARKLLPVLNSCESTYPLPPSPLEEWNESLLCDRSENFNTIGHLPVTTNSINNSLPLDDGSSSRFESIRVSNGGSHDAGNIQGSVLNTSPYYTDPESVHHVGNRHYFQDIPSAFERSLPTCTRASFEQSDRPADAAHAPSRHANLASHSGYHQRASNALQSTRESPNYVWDRPLVYPPQTSTQPQNQLATAERTAVFRPIPHGTLDLLQRATGGHANGRYSDSSQSAFIDPRLLSGPSNHLSAGIVLPYRGPESNNVWQPRPE